MESRRPIPSYPVLSRLDSILAPGFMISVYNDMFYNLKSLKRASDHELCRGICRAIRDVSESIFGGGGGGNMEGPRNNSCPYGWVTKYIQ